MTRQDIIPSNSDAQAPGALERNRARVERGFWTKLKRSVGRVPFLEDAVSAYYAAFDPQTPRSVKAMLLAALAYFVVPSDLVPDFIAGLGFTDDATVLFTTIRLVAGHIGERHHEQARQRLQLLGLLDDATPAMASGPRSGPGEGS
ncbi:MAG TPA: YkvA family protein [Kiloniellaceae bacterium]